MSALPARSAILPASGLASSIDLDRKIGLLVEAVRADDRQFPGERSGLLHRNPDGLRAAARGDRRGGEDDCSQQRANEKFHYSLSRFLERLLFSTTVIA